MKIHVDKATDAVYFRLDDSPILDSEEIRPGIILDFNQRNEIVGFEILQASQRTTPTHLQSVQVEVV